MGLTPLEGLIMGTRSGDIDPAIVFFLARVTGRSNDELESLLNKESGLKGICGANDMREILRRACEGDARADLAIEMYVYRLKKYIGAYYAALGRVDGIAFTAGIGENAAEIRARACDGLSGLGIDLDPRKNAARSQDIREIQAQGASVKVMVIPTDEELEIADETVECIQRSR
jgi:acetate kinase